MDEVKKIIQNYQDVLDHDTKINVEEHVQVENPRLQVENPRLDDALYMKLTRNVLKD